MTTPFEVNFNVIYGNLTNGTCLASIWKFDFMSDKRSGKLQSRSLPAVDLVLRQPVCEEFASIVDRQYLTQFVRQEIQSLREKLARIDSEQNSAIEFDETSIAEAAVSRARTFLKGGLRRVINGTGVILNTNLGRSPLPLSVL